MPISYSRDTGLPRRFGEFLLFDKIGQGGMAEIFLAKTLGTLGQQRLTVIKSVLPLLSADPQFSEMLVEEAKLCASLSHKNVVQVTDLGRVENQLYIAMEYVEGFDLNDLLRRCTRAKVPLPAEFVFLIIEETLAALDFAHRAHDDQGAPLHIIHRDVSPTNVLISCEGEIKLCDFGIARATARDGALPQGALKGKFAYMSPEQARGDIVDQRSDLFAAGILLWELIAGHRLYRGDAGEVLSQAQAGEVPPLPDRGLPRYEHLAVIADKALSAEPEERYQTAQEMIFDLGEYVHAAGLFASQLRFAQFLRDNFGDELQRQRRERERAATALTPTASTAPFFDLDSPQASPPPLQPEVAASSSPAPNSAPQRSSAPESSGPPPEIRSSSPQLEVVGAASPPPAQPFEDNFEDLWRDPLDSERPTEPRDPLDYYDDDEDEPRDDPEAALDSGRAVTPAPAADHTLIRPDKPMEEIFAESPAPEPAEQSAHSASGATSSEPESTSRPELSPPPLWQREQSTLKAGMSQSAKSIPPDEKPSSQSSGRRSSTTWLWLLVALFLAAVAAGITYTTLN